MKAFSDILLSGQLAGGREVTSGQREKERRGEIYMLLLLPTEA